MRLSLILGAVAALPLTLPAVAVAGKCPNVMLVVDRSGSMLEPPDDGSNLSKWLLLQAAVQRVIAKYGDRVPFGLETYAFPTGIFANDTACYAESSIDVEPAHGTAPAILNRINHAMPEGSTNTGEAIQRAAADPVMHDKERTNLIILITDGDPNCNRGDACMNCMAGFTVKQIGLAADGGIHTFVVAFEGTGVTPENLNAMAKAGKQPRNDGFCGDKNTPCYYSASSADSFTAAIDAIIGTVVIGGEFGGMGLCDDTCLTDGCKDGEICSTTMDNALLHCIPDPCIPDPGCMAGSYCRGGACVQACVTPCGGKTSCSDGVCVPDKCRGVMCSPGQLCSPTTGSCINDPCNGTCGAGQLCDLAQNKCVPDACRLVHCPSGMFCVRGGSCESYAQDAGVPATPDMAMSIGETPTNTRRGCSVAQHGDPRALLTLPALLALGLLLRRRRPAFMG